MLEGCVNDLDVKFDYTYMYTSVIIIMLLIRVEPGDSFPVQLRNRTILKMLRQYSHFISTTDLLRLFKHHLYSMTSFHTFLLKLFNGGVVLYFFRLHNGMLYFLFISICLQGWYLRILANGNGLFTFLCLKWSEKEIQKVENVCHQSVKIFKYIH